MWTVASAAAAPSRVASLNLCTDSMLFELLPDERIASVTHLSRDRTLSPFHRRAARLAANHGEVEEILGTTPDLVISGAPAAPLANRLLQRLEVPARAYPHANDFTTYRRNLLDLASVLGVVPRAERLLAELQRALGAAAVRPEAATRTALIYQPNGYSPGRDTLMHALLAAAGLRNLAATRRGADGGYFALEEVMALAPDVLVFSMRDSGSRPALAEQQLTHPALLRWLQAGTSEQHPRTVHVPEQWWTCAGAYNRHALAHLREAS